MNRILEINKADLVAVVEPAVTNYQLQKAVEAEGLFYPPDPSSWRESSSEAISRSTPAGRDA